MAEQPEKPRRGARGASKGPQHASGHAKRTARKARQEAERRTAGITVQRYRDIGPAPSNAIGRSRWAGRILAELAYETLTDETLDAPARRKQAGDLLDKLNRGATKALYEETIEELERRLGVTPAEAGRDGVDEEPAATGGTPLRADPARERQ